MFCLQLRDRGCHRPGRRRIRREPGAAERQRDWVHDVRIRPERKMAGTAQTDRARRTGCGKIGGAKRVVGSLALMSRPAPRA